MKYILKLFFTVCLYFAIVPLAKAEAPYSLNVVYFIPQDDEAVEGFESRLSDLLLYIQKFYRKEMIRNGFGNKTFGLVKEGSGKVKIIVLRGEEKIPYYSYADGGGYKAEREIGIYFTKHPEEKKSNHTLVIMPSTSNDDMRPGGVPFYGIGKYCFALDYPYFDIKYLGENSPKGRLLTKWFGGMAHELGHGLNLPHNSAQVTEGEKLGTALMGSGNHTFGLKPTFLTKASCAILNNCEVFATRKKRYYDKDTNFKLEGMEIAFTDDKVLVKGHFKTVLPINGVNIYIDHSPYGQVNNDYDAESWTVKPRKDNHFAIEIPRSELHKRGNCFQVRVRLLCANGMIHTQVAEFNWEDLKTYQLVKS